MPSKIEFIPGSLATELNAFKKHFSPNHPVSISNVLMPPYSQKNDGKHRVMVYPDNKIIEFDNDSVERFVEHYLLPEKHEITETYNPFKAQVQRMCGRVAHDSHFREVDLDRGLVAICGHTQRDVRCGEIAPLLKNEFEKVFAIEGIHDVSVGLISHVGGHAYAGNVLYFPKKSIEKPLFFYGRVFPSNVQGIVEETIKSGGIIKELYRGHI